MTDWIIAVLIVGGGVFAVIGAVGLLRLPDVLIRMHASTKIGTLACALVMAGAAVGFGATSEVARAVLIVLFLLLTAPIGSHMIGRAAIATGVPLWNTKFLSGRFTRSSGENTGAGGPGGKGADQDFLSGGSS